MASRIDQQLRVTKIMIESHRIADVYAVSKKLGKYMRKYITMMMTISNIFCEICEFEDKDQKREDLWKYMKEYDIKTYNYVKHKSIFSLANIQNYVGRKTAIGFYRIARRIYKFN